MQSYAGLNNTSFNGVNGGRPMLLDGDIVLCGHSDAGVNGSYDGALSSLALFDMAFNASKIELIYNEVLSQCQCLSDFCENATKLPDIPKTGRTQVTR